MMSGDEYKEILKDLGLTQTGFSRWAGYHGVTGKTWTRRGPPPAVQLWLRYLKARHMTPADVNAAIDEVAA